MKEYFSKVTTIKTGARLLLLNLMLFTSTQAQELLLLFGDEPEEIIEEGAMIFRKDSLAIPELIKQTLNKTGEQKMTEKDETIIIEKIPEAPGPEILTGQTKIVVGIIEAEKLQKSGWRLVSSSAIGEDTRLIKEKTYTFTKPQEYK